MPEKPNKLSQFWQELKRRKVFRVIAMYAATAFIIMEAGDIMLPRLGLPDWTVSFIIVLLIIGFPISVILAWIFDITPEGVKKTESIEVTKEQESPSVSAKRRLRVSDVIIAMLVVVVGILAYPKIFKKDKFEGIRDADGRISVAVMPFENLSGDSSYNVWQSGFQNLLISTLSNSDELQVRQYQTMSTLIGQKKNLIKASITPSLARELAFDLKTKTYILGSIMKTGNKVRISTQIIDAATEEIYKTHQVEGNAEGDAFALADSLSGMIRNYLEIRKLIGEYDTPEINEFAFSKSAEAFQYYMRGWEAFGKMDLQTTIEWLSKAIETDSNFINAYIFLSFTYIPGGYLKLSKQLCKKAYEKRNELPVREQLFLDHLYAYHFENPHKEIRICKKILDIDEMNSIYWYFLGDAYYRLNQYEEATLHWKKALDIHKKWGTVFGIPHLYFYMGDALHKLNDHKREREIYELGLNALPNTALIIIGYATCVLSLEETEKAKSLINNYISIRKSKGWNESQIMSSLGDVYSGAGLFDEAEVYYRQALALDSLNPQTLNNYAWLLINNDINVNDGVDLVVKALELEPDDPITLDTWGWGLYKQGEYEEALKILNKSWELRITYVHEIFQHIQEVKKALASQNK